MLASLMHRATGINCHIGRSRVPGGTTRRYHGIQRLREMLATRARRRGARRAAVTLRCGQRAGNRRERHPEKAHPDDHHCRQSTKHRQQLQFPPGQTTAG